MNLPETERKTKSPSQHSQTLAISFKNLNLLNSSSTRTSRMELFVPDVLKGFHSIDRSIYIRLLQHGFDLDNSKFIVALWYFLDKKNNFKFMAEKIEPIGDADFRELAYETACFIRLIIDSDVSQPTEFRRLFEVVPNFGLVLRNREEAKRQMDLYMKEVCEKAFGDIIYQYLNGIIGLHNCPPSVVPNFGPKIANSQSFPSKQAMDDEQRSLYFTFSKGHPVSIEELETLIRRWNLEDRVEEIKMISMLSALVLCKSPDDVRKIVGDEEGGTVHCSINGKDVRVRQSVRRGSQMGKDTLKRPLFDPSLPH